MAQSPINYEYYYGNEAEQYTFYRLPKALFTDNRYKNLSDGAKILYGLMLDRMGLSVRNNWLDEENRVYIYFTLEDLQEYMNCGHNKGVKIMSELDNIGLIERVKRGQGKPTRILIKRFFTSDNDLCHEYYYGNEAEQYTFYRLPKALFTDNRYKNLSDGAKILYGLMLDRMGLSVRNNWLDEENRVYIYFTLEDLQEYMSCGHNKGVKIMSELDNIGLIERVKQGQGRPTKILVKKFFTTDNNLYRTKTDGSSGGNQGAHGAEVQTSENGNSRFPTSKNQDVSKQEIKTSENGTSRLPINGTPNFPKTEIQTSDNGKCRLLLSGSADFPITDTNNTYLTNPEINKTDVNNINPIQSYLNRDTAPTAQSGLDRIDGIGEMNAYREMIKENVEYDCLSDRYGKERMDELIELLTDTVCSKRNYICISGDEYPKDVVKSRLLKLHQFHIEYVFDCIDKNTTKVRNIKKYLLASLYNAPTTMDTYYRAEVNHDLYGNH